MPIEQRVVSAPKIGGNTIKGGGSAAAAEPEAPAKKSKKKLLIIVAAVVLVAGGAGAYFMLGKSGGDAAAPAPEPTHEPGAVVAVDAHSLNLADGHYLRLGLSLQLTADVGEETPDTSKAVDLAIDVFSGHTVDEVSDPATRDQLKAELLEKLEEAYDGEVMDVYFTDYVTQ